MRESVFKFKQFSVKNSISAMKVGTDGVLLGAWCSVSDDLGYILDIGAGTGLISLMIAQRSNACVIGVELSPEAVLEAQYNVNESPWCNRISIVNEDFNNYIASCTLKFKHIVSNPPFFDDGIKSPIKDRAVARHTDSLTYDNLLCGSAKLLSDDGKISLITPYDVKNKILSIAESCGLKLNRLTTVYPKATSSPKRILWEFSKIEKIIKEDSLIIEIARHIYSLEYIELTKKFYLKM